MSKLVRTRSTGTLSYTENPALYNVGLPIPNNIPIVSGATVTVFAISPALPPGLKFNTSTGIISGTPLEASPSTTYTITGDGGLCSGSLVIKVDNTNLAAIRKKSNYNQKQNCIQRKAKFGLNCLCSTDSCQPTNVPF